MTWNSWPGWLLTNAGPVTTEIWVDQPVMYYLLTTIWTFYLTYCKFHYYRCLTFILGCVVVRTLAFLLWHNTCFFIILTYYEAIQKLLVQFKLEFTNINSNFSILFSSSEINVFTNIYFSEMRKMLFYFFVDVLDILFIFPVSTCQQ